MNVNTYLWKGTEIYTIYNQKVYSALSWLFLHGDSHSPLPKILILASVQVFLFWVGMFPSPDVR